MAQYVEVNGHVVEFPDGMKPAEIETAIKANIMSLKPAKPASVSMGEEVNAIPRQIGLAARYGAEGLANLAQIGTEPIRAIMDKVLGTKTAPLGEAVSHGLDAIGLPSPQGANERVIADASRLVAGGGLSAGAAKAASVLPGMVGNVMSSLAANPVQQLTAAAGAGLAGGASREANGSPLMQFGASLLGGVAGGLAPGVAGSAANSIKEMIPGIKTSPQQINIQIEALLRSQGIEFRDLAPNVQNSLRTELGEAMRTGKDLNPDAVRRLTDFRVSGLTPTRGMLTQDPVQITREMNLAKIGANSGDSQLQGLARVQNENNAKMIGALDNAGAARGNLINAGASSVNRIRATDDAMGQRVSEMYTAARNMPGGETQLNRADLINNINAALARENKGAFLPGEIESMLNTIAGGVTKSGHPVPFDAKALDNLLTTIATAQRGTKDGNVKAALNIVRQAIDATPIQPIKTTFGGNQVVTDAGAQFLRNQDAQAGQFMDALNQARSAARQRFGWQESSRPVEAVIGGIEPDKFIKRFVINGSIDDARAVAQSGDRAAVRDAILTYMKDQALSNASSEVGKFSQSAFNKAIKELGPKLGLFFDRDEIAQLESLGRAASYAMSQPVGSAVNNSNSGALLLGRGLDLLKNAGMNLPFFGPMVTQPAAAMITGAVNSHKAAAAQQIIPSLLGATEPRMNPAALAIPAITYGGGLLSQ